MSVLNPFRTTEQTILQDTDLAGPLVFCLTLGSFLLLVRTNNSILLIIIWKSTQKLEIIRFFFGAFIPHLQSGKVHFSYIYGIGVLGCLAFYALLTVMATQSSVTLGSVVSVLGYCLLPMVVLSGINVLIALQWVKTEFRYQFLFVSSAKIYNQYFNLSSRFFSVTEEHSVLYWPACAFYGVRHQHQSYLSPPTQWTINKSWSLIHVHCFMVFLRWSQFSRLQIRIYADE